jgi:hypothetical protein
VAGEPIPGAVARVADGVFSGAVSGVADEALSGGGVVFMAAVFHAVLFMRRCPNKYTLFEKYER